MSPSPASVHLSKRGWRTSARKWCCINKLSHQNLVKRSMCACTHTPTCAMEIKRRLSRANSPDRDARDARTVSPSPDVFLPALLPGWRRQDPWPTRKTTPSDMAPRLALAKDHTHTVRHTHTHTHTQQILSARRSRTNSHVDYLLMIENGMCHKCNSFE